MFTAFASRVGSALRRPVTSGYCMSPPAVGSNPIVTYTNARGICTASAAIHTRSALAPVVQHAMSKHNAEQAATQAETYAGDFYDRDCPQLANDPADFHRFMKHTRQFLEDEGCIEAELSTLLDTYSNCESPDDAMPMRFLDPVSRQYEYFPAPQTLQMRQESLILDPSAGVDGVFTSGVSYRREQDADFVRRMEMFNLVEFEKRGDFNALVGMLQRFFLSLGYKPEEVRIVNYDDACKHFGVEEIDDEEERLLGPEFGAKVVQLIRFPEHTHPFFNMKRQGDVALKMDVIAGGWECVGSAERESDLALVKHHLATSVDGKYLDSLVRASMNLDRLDDGVPLSQVYEEAKQRVERDMGGYFALFERLDGESDAAFKRRTTRFGGGISSRRIIRALKLDGLW